MTRPSFCYAAIAVCFVLLAQGCAGRRAGETVGRAGPVDSQQWVETIGLSVQQRPIEAYIFGDGPETVLFLGSIHGSEPAGAVLCDELIARLEPKDYVGMRVVVVPSANPDGLAAGRRTNARGIDLNRNFPSDNYLSKKHGGDRPLSEPESRALYDLILKYRPILVVSIHQPLSLVDYDGPAKAAAKLLSKEVGLPVRRLGGLPGSMGSWVGEDLGIGIITLELPGNASERDGQWLWEAYGQGLLDLIF